MNEASIRVIEAPMKTLSLPPNVLRPQGIDISSGKFITFQRGTEKIMARVKEIKTGVAGEKVTVEVLSRDGSFARVDLQGERLLSTIKAPSERSMRHLAPLFETPSGGVASSIPKPATVMPEEVPPPPKVPQVADVPQRLPGAPEAKGPIPGLVSRKAPSPPDIPAPKSIGSPPVVAPAPAGGGFFASDFFRGRKYLRSHQSVLLAPVIRSPKPSGSASQGLSKVVNHGDGGTEAIERIHQLGFYPTEEIVVNGGKIKVGPLFEIGDSGRVGAYMLVNIEGKETLRFAYRSSSQGTFRILPARNDFRSPIVPGYDKGIGEFALEVPLEVQKQLSAQLTRGPPIKRVGNADELINSTVVKNKDLMAWMDYQKSPGHINTQVTPNRVAPKLDTIMKSRNPSDVVISGNAAPDFSPGSMISTYKTKSVVAVRFRCNGFSK